MVTLHCAETMCTITPGEPVYGAINRQGEVFYSLSPEVVDRIPAAARRPFACPPRDQGINIHDAITWDAYEREDPEQLVLGDFVFSVSEQAARRYLPRIAEKLIPIRVQ